MYIIIFEQLLNYEKPKKISLRKDEQVSLNPPPTEMDSIKVGTFITTAITILPPFSVCCSQDSFVSNLSDVISYWLEGKEDDESTFYGDKFPKVDVFQMRSLIC